VTAHPGLRRGALSIAALYDMQHDPELREAMTFVSPTSGEQLGQSFIIPRTRASWKPAA
jgi:4-hydroxyphenylacetate 3-monooxygenase